MNPVKIDTNAIPAVERDILCNTLLKAVKRFYADPKNRADFEAWLAETGGMLGRGKEPTK